jgi:hypothetical protein
MITRASSLRRTTVTQSFRQILGEEASPVIRRVQIFVPSQPNVYAIITPDERFVDRDTGQPLKNAAHAAGLDRSYKGTRLTSGAQIIFHLLPDQTLWASCEIEYAELGLLVEFLPPTP